MKLNRFKHFFIAGLFILPLMETARSFTEDELQTGTILEILESGGYSYFYIDGRDSTFWIAVRETPAYVGAKITFQGQMWMPDFNSSTLGMTFPNILFSGDAYIVKSEDSSMSQVVQSNSVTRLPGTLPIIDVYRNSEKLAGDSVIVQGEAVKVMHKVMGKTWIHLRDDSAPGDSATIIITTLDTSIKVGNIISAQGILAIDKDFGFGYFYSVIMEDAILYK